MTRLALRALLAEAIDAHDYRTATIAAMALDGCPSALDACGRILARVQADGDAEARRERSATLRADLAFRVTL